MLKDIFSPEVQNRPAEKKEFFIIFSITVLVTSDLVDPEFRVLAFFKAQFKNIPIFSMEELTVTENSNFVFCESDVWRAGKCLIVFTVPIALVPKSFPQLQFNGSIGTVDVTHVV